MLKEVIDGFCMALADSVPGVSGGTVAFVMGFYDQLIGSVHNLIFGKKSEKKEAARFLAKLAAGWIIGMVLAILVLSAMFESHIYLVSSLFIGLIAGSIPVIVREEKESLREAGKGILFFAVGIAAVVGITWMNGRVPGTVMDLEAFSIGLGIRLFLIGMTAVSAMFLPGISGSTLLLIFGAYIPVITAVRGVLSLNPAYIPGLLFFGCGIIAGALTIVKLIQVCLEKFRPQMVYLILGMMIGSFYAIVMGPTTLDSAQEALSMGTFSWAAGVIGAGLVVCMQIIKRVGDRHGN